MAPRALSLALLLIAARSLAQPALFDLASVREIKLRFAQADWRAQLEALYVQGDDGRLIGDIEIDGTQLPDVAVRFKGYSSYSAGRVKNPFNIDLNAVHDGQGYQGFNKIKLSNVFQDPSFLREVLTYEIARQYMPASRAAYANVWVNDTLLGLYNVVEDVGRDFVQEHFGSRDGSFFKGNPPTVDLTGENCSLSDALGYDSANYYNLYSIQSDHGWSHLLELIDALNQHPERIDTVLNVDRALWMHALNYALINFDSYVGYAQNYYLYRDADGLWNTIPWDMNMSFGAFRLTDASTYWNGFSITQAMSIDPMSHYNGVSVFPRPLIRSLLQDPMRRRMYIAHIRAILEDQVASGDMGQLAQQIRAVIDPHVQADTNKFYSYQGFLDNLNEQVSFTIAYPGLAQLMNGRIAYMQTYPGFTGHPAIGAVQYAPFDIGEGQPITVTSQVSGADTVFIAYRFSNLGVFERTAMLDDGLHGDGAAGDGTYGASFIASANLIEYYLYAENATAGEFSPRGAAYRTHRIFTRLSPGALVINELMADNRLYPDASGATGDWIELYNASGSTISTAGLYLSDDPADPEKWFMSAFTLAPGEYLMLWADEREGIDDYHTNFKLDAEGETLMLSYAGGDVLDQVNYGAQYPIYSWARSPNGTGEFKRMAPTFKGYNHPAAGFDPDAAFQLWPNPASTQVHAFIDRDGAFEIEVFRADGRRMAGPIKLSSRQLVEVDAYGLSAGHYTLRARFSDATLSKPFIIIP
ncbi:MAG: CotH kinase family protein [Flavobacteriales bacterium]|nr:CotH kinase family protein [Flavobacteriales bacterium]